MAFWSGKKDKVAPVEQQGMEQNKTEGKVDVATNNVANVDEVVSFVPNKLVRNKERTVPSGITLTGQVSFDSAVKIEGHINGELFSASTVTVALMGELNGTLEAEAFDVYGKVNGELRARNKIILRNGAEVIAKVISPKLEIEEGAYLEGDVIPLVEKANLKAC